MLFLIWDAWGIILYLQVRNENALKPNVKKHISAFFFLPYIYSVLGGLFLPLLNAVAWPCAAVRCKSLEKDLGCAPGPLRMVVAWGWECEAVLGMGCLMHPKSWCWGG